MDTTVVVLLVLVAVLAGVCVGSPSAVVAPAGRSRAA
jgi:hypothetical protein